jgi:hypothetical protein
MENGKDKRDQDNGYAIRDQLTSFAQVQLQFFDISLQPPRQENRLIRTSGLRRRNPGSRFGLVDEQLG